MKSLLIAVAIFFSSAMIHAQSCPSGAVPIQGGGTCATAAGTALQALTGIRGVDPTGSTTYTTIQAAINSLPTTGNQGGAILLQPGLTQACPTSPWTQSGVTLMTEGSVVPPEMFTLFNNPATFYSFFSGPTNANLAVIDCPGGLTLQDVNRITIKNVIFDMEGTGCFTLTGVNNSEFAFAVVNVPATCPQLSYPPDAVNNYSNVNNTFDYFIGIGGNAGIVAGSSTFNPNDAVATNTYWHNIQILATTQPTGMFTVADFPGADDSNYFDGCINFAALPAVTARNGIVFGTPGSVVDTDADGIQVKCYAETAAGTFTNGFPVVENYSSNNTIQIATAKSGAAPPYNSGAAHNYVNSFVTYSGTIYQSIQDNGTATTVVTPGTNTSYWMPATTDSQNLVAVISPPSSATAYSNTTNYTATQFVSSGGAIYGSILPSGPGLGGAQPVTNTAYWNNQQYNSPWAKLDVVGPSYPAVFGSYNEFPNVIMDCGVQSTCAPGFRFNRAKVNIASEYLGGDNNLYLNSVAAGNFMKILTSSGIINEYKGFNVGDTGEFSVANNGNVTMYGSGGVGRIFSMNSADNSTNVFAASVPGNFFNVNLLTNFYQGVTFNSTATFDDNLTAINTINVAPVTSGGVSAINLNNYSNVTQYSHQLGTDGNYHFYRPNSGSLTEAYNIGASTGNFTFDDNVYIPTIESSSGQSCLQIDTAGKMTNTGAACGGTGATQSGVQQQAYSYAADTGTANAYAVTLSPTPTLVAGSDVVFKAANANTGSSTLAVNSGSPVTIYKKGGTTALTGGEIAAGQVVRVVYDGTYFQMQSQSATTLSSPSAGLTANYYPVASSSNVLANGTLDHGVTTAGTDTDSQNLAATGIKVNSVATPAAPTGVTSTTGGTIPASSTFGAITCIDSSGVNTTAAGGYNGYTTTGSTSKITWSFTLPSGCTTGYLWLGPTVGFTYYTVVSGTSFVQTAAYNTYTPVSSYPVGGVFPGYNNGYGTTGIIDLSANANLGGIKMRSTYGLEYIAPSGNYPLGSTSGMSFYGSGGNGTFYFTNTDTNWNMELATAGSFGIGAAPTWNLSAASNKWGVDSNGLTHLTVGTAISSSSTIAPVSAITHVTGTTTISTITAPTSCTATSGVACQITIIPDGLWSTTTGGNIAVATTAVVSKAVTFTYDPGTSLWYPSY